MQRDFKGVWIPKHIWLNNDLSMIEKVLIIEIDSLDNEKKGCFASNKYLADFCGCSESAISKAISKLIKLDLLYCKNFDGRQRELKSKLGRLLNNDSLPSKIYQADCHILQDNNIDNNIDNNNKGDLSSNNKKITKEKIEDLIKEFEIYPTKGWLELIQDWLDYKKSRKEEYKRIQDVKKFTNELIKLSGSSLDIAKQIVDKSIICSWKGIFPLNDNKNKNNGYLGKYNGFF